MRKWRCFTTVACILAVYSSSALAQESCDNSSTGVCGTESRELFPSARQGETPAYSRFNSPIIPGISRVERGISEATSPVSKNVSVLPAKMPVKSSKATATPKPGISKSATPVSANDRPKPTEILEMTLFYAYDCPHCHEAIKWFPTLAQKFPLLKISKYEIKRSKENRNLFAQRLSRHKSAPAGVPTFFIGDRMLVGFIKGQTESEITAAVLKLAGNPDSPCKEEKEITIPFIGSINPSSISILQFSFLLGLLDGLNPCAMWVLIFLMGLLIHSKSTRKMLLVGGIFVAASAFVYFTFMAAWFNIFTVIGSSRWITLALGLIAVLMGLINIKEVFFFKQGVSLMIPESARPKLAEKIRRIINEKETLLAVAGTVLLALFVNLIELGCTIGLPAIFTRVLSVRQAGFWEKYYYMGIYNAAYVIPLAFIVAVFVITMGRYKMTETHAKVLKGISGILMLLLGLLMAFKPELLVLS